VLGPQASPPARAQRNQEQLFEPLDETELVLFDAGRRGRLRSQDDDPCGRVCSHLDSELLEQYFIVLL